MTMTDPNDVRRQFEEWAKGRGWDTYYFNGKHRNASVHCAFEAYQAALQSPAVRELVEALRKAEGFVDRHSEPWYRSGQSLLAEIRAALRTLGAGHVE